MRKVYVLGREGAYEQMFLRNGWDVCHQIEDAEYVQFTGGSDVDPMLYSEPRHPTTHSDPARDARESNIFQLYEGEKKFLGICRGAQFLNVMCGGAMWQNVDNHAVSSGHMALDLDSNQSYEVSSTHHQMMRPSLEGSILVTAGLTTFKEDGFAKYTQRKEEADRDVEAVLYEEYGTLCFQPHPEFFDENHPCQILYFSLINRFLS